ncbi:MAG: stilbene synthase [Verrucomicrobia bacterium]|jgi:alkylresorcinol/alkylpyrone synthase|nr:stilbene synthase [Verrucomicrobiota bacterium]
MYLQSISHAVPRQSFTQDQCWEALQGARVFKELKTRSKQLLEKILLGRNGIEKRHFATDRIEDLFSRDADSLNKSFEAEAPKLAEAALGKALARAGISADELDALFICTCSGYLCPGVSSYVAEHMALPRHCYLQDIVGLGCGAGIPTLRSAQGFLATHPEATVACIAVEVCSAAFYIDDDPGVLISASLFGDAASASIWTGQANNACYRIDQFDTIHVPESREALRFTNRGGKLRNQLHRSVPEVAALAVKELQQRAQLPSHTKIAAHVGGRDVLIALESALGCPRLDASWEALAQYGNTSSPSVLIAAEKILMDEPCAEHIWLASFGAGFAAHACRLSRYASSTSS